MTLRALCPALAATLLLAGCGGDSSNDSGGTASTPAAGTTTAAETTAAPATTTEAPAETTPAATGTQTTPAPASSGTEVGEENRKDAITVRGRKGDTLTLIGQYATSVSGAVKKREKVKVTLLRIRGPFSGFDLTEGHKLIGFDLKVSNVGKIRFDDPLPSGTLILVGGENGKPTSLISGTNKNPCDNPSLKLKPGQSKEVCVAFDVPKSAKLETFQYAVDSGYGDTGLWRLR